ncbi:3-hydroxyacyl-ACP dehydratase FabZ [Asticcacaulis endophyticus]|uniref:3-hydroxyacyl-[acyl-carrier-protein] dehydratase FabZ n=1 Tax=Asticcacaulis endophyticus TaxID=1395890 RepID=A0A918QA78_9CAUL|nr:3-hydroxyacyl-ACP dehydratase FabZ [Asticcacaulis endophyticus]GGZ37362.1 3-hydroxyacyl-[acyl-carrier-protein] dehydratase FabZ [Asticcacaulis endophyticus]
MTEEAAQAVAEVQAVNPDQVVGDSIDYAEILRRIPHRYPFLLIDRGENWIKNKSMTGIKNVTFNEPFFPGHFPENPVMPGVLIIEAIGQTGAVLMSKSLDADVEGKTIFFMSVDGARFRSPVRPGDTLHMKVEVLRHRGDVFKFKGEAYVNGKVVCECEFAAMVVESPK